MRTRATALVALIGAYLSLWPVDVAPVAWRPPPAAAPWEGEALDAVERIPLGGAVGGEDVAVLPDGRVVTGVQDGRILQVLPCEGDCPRALADTGGRPLGLDVGDDGRLYIADGERGLLVLDGAEVRPVPLDGVELHLADDVEVHAGVAYVSDATDRFPLARWRDDILENGAHGRLIAVDLQTRAARVLLEGLHFANGVAIDSEGRFVLVCETARYRVVRVWLGDREGEVEVFATVPGFPDGVTADDAGGFWVALASPRKASLDAVAAWPALRRVVARLPALLQPKPVRAGGAVRLDGDGRIVEARFDPDGSHVVTPTSVEPYGDTLWIGSLSMDAIARTRR